MEMSNNQQYCEDAVLGCILAENYLINDLPLKDEYFSGQNKMLLAAMKVCADAGLPIDVVTLITRTNPQDFGGVEKLQQIQKLANVKKVDGYLKVLEDVYKERETHKVLSIGLEENKSAGEVISLLSAIDTNNVSDRHDANDLAVDFFNMPWEEISGVLGMKTGINKLDLFTSGFQDADLVIIGARPSMGKTDMMTHFVYSASKAGYLPVIFSLEMPAKKIFNRMIGQVGGINRNKLKDPNKYLSDKEKDNWSIVMGEIANTGMIIFDKAGQTTQEIRAKVRKVQGENKGKKLALFLDYLTLIRSEEKLGTEALKVTKITEDLKAIAKEFQAPFTVLAQLSRSVEQRQDKRPMMSDLRESGGIEQAADVIGFLYRDSYYSGDENDRSMEFLIAKNREGQTGTIICEYNKFTGVIRDAD